MAWAGCSTSTTTSLPSSSAPCCLVLSWTTCSKSSQRTCLQRSNSPLTTGFWDPTLLSSPTASTCSHLWPTEWTGPYPSTKTAQCMD
uniref:Putative secreted protein n=1 Tax=Ixodes scapularis TaxID=6945 RepID=A0A4D5RAK5_IXOSC